MDKFGYLALSLDFINDLEGYKTSFKNFHWSAPDLTYHRQIDSFLDKLIEFQDEIAEQSQGYANTQYGINTIQGTKFEFADPRQALDALDARVLSFLQQINNDLTLSGVVNAINDFQQTILQNKYLFRLADKVCIENPDAGEAKMVDLGNITGLM